MNATQRDLDLVAMLVVGACGCGNLKHLRLG